MAFIGCVTSKTPDTLLNAIEESVKENAHGRLMHLLQGGSVECSDIRRLNLLHLAAWLGYPHCVRLLLEMGVHPDEPHSKNGCTPLHLAHFCTVENTSPSDTVHQLIEAGASVNNPGSSKCGRHPLHHAIQHQRVDSVKVLLDVGASISLESVLVAIDVTSPDIVSLLLSCGAQCGRKMRSVMYWGRPMHRVLSAPLKCPRESYRLMFTVMVQATVSRPLMFTPGNQAKYDDSELRYAPYPATATHQQQQHTEQLQSTIESELRSLAKTSSYLALYLYVYLVRNGYVATRSFHQYAMDTLLADCRPATSSSTTAATASSSASTATGLGLSLGLAATDSLSWIDTYHTQPLPLCELCVRVVRSYLYLSGNVVFGVKKLRLPAKIEERVLLVNPF